MARWSWSWKRVEGRKYEMSLSIRPTISDVAHIFKAWAHNTAVQHFGVGPLRGIQEIEFRVTGDIWMPPGDIDCELTSTYSPSTPPADKIDLLMRS